MEWEITINKEKWRKANNFKLKNNENFIFTKVCDFNIFHHHTMQFSSKCMIINAHLFSSYKNICSLEGGTRLFWWIEVIIVIVIYIIPWIIEWFILTNCTNKNIVRNNVEVVFSREIERNLFRKENTNHSNFWPFLKNHSTYWLKIDIPSSCKSTKILFAEK